MRRTFALVALVTAAFGIGSVGSAAGQADSGCTSHFPSVTWGFEGSSGTTDVHTAGLDEGIAQRALLSVERSIGLMDGQLTPPVASTVCVFGAGIDLDPVGVGPPDERVHAVVFAEEAVIAVDAQLLTLLEPSVTYGLAYAWLWHTAADLGLEGYPEPLATAVAQWYRARVTRRLDNHHAIMRTGLFFADPEGDDPSRDWAAGAQPSVFRWNPQFNDSPIGDVV
ncbi:MAG: hypothetical protein ACE5GC_06635, partial [Acidimicrobiia bacterium]